MMEKERREVMRETERQMREREQKRIEWRVREDIFAIDPIESKYI
jgi:hypothetical protein